MLDSTLSNEARNMLFLVAAWMANVDGKEQGAEVDALCQLRGALGLEPPVARKLLQIARSRVDHLFEPLPR
jgi:tellurite resistance protein